MGLFTRNRKPEDRALPAPDVTPGLQPYWSAAPLDVTTSNVLRVSDAYAAVRCLADSVASLPLHVYRRTEAGRGCPLDLRAARCNCCSGRRRAARAST
jgi:hypothetical protein